MMDAHSEQADLSITLKSAFGTDRPYSRQAVLSE
jgi:hypothetical protein